MKVIADRERCDGYGACLEASPEVFDLDDDDLVLLLDAEPDESLRAGVTRAVRVCPKSALSIEG